MTSHQVSHFCNEAEFRTVPSLTLSTPLAQVPGPKVPELVEKPRKAQHSASHSTRRRTYSKWQVAATPLDRLLIWKHQSIFQLTFPDIALLFLFQNLDQTKHLHPEILRRTTLSPADTPDKLAVSMAFTSGQQTSTMTIHRCRRWTPARRTTLRWAPPTPAAVICSATCPPVAASNSFLLLLVRHLLLLAWYLLLWRKSSRSVETIPSGVRSRPC